MSNRVCAVTCCRNNGYKLAKWNSKVCEVHDKLKKHCDCQKPFELYPFPTERKDPYGRLMWAKLIQRKNGDKNWQPKEDSRVCSVHFVDNKPTILNPYPTLHLGYSDAVPIKARPPPSARRCLIPVKTTQWNKQTSKSTCTVVSDEIPQVLENLSPQVSEKISPQVSPQVSENVAVQDIENNLPERNNHDNADNNTTVTPSVSNHGHKPILGDHDYFSTCQGCTDKNSLIWKLQLKIKKLEVENMALKQVVKLKAKKPFNINATVLSSDIKTKFYTGLPSVDTFNTIYDYISSNVPSVRYWKGPKRVSNPLRRKHFKNPIKRTLSSKEELVMTMMKLRLGLLNTDLADRFGVSSTHVSNVITTWLRILSKVLGSLVFNPPKEIVKCNLPVSFQTPIYNRVRHIIDCTEVFIEKPNNLKLQSQTWSDYKHHHTAKTLVSITPAGIINFVSPSYGGRASDKHVTLNSGFLDLIEDYDTVMADRGFPIREELALLNAELLIPPGRRGVSQMSTLDVQKTKQIANRRIYIEQAIRRMKFFRILKYELPLTLLHHLDNILLIVCGTCNLYPPLPKGLK